MNSMAQPARILGMCPPGCEEPENSRTAVQEFEVDPFNSPARFRTLLAPWRRKIWVRVMNRNQVSENAED